MKNLLTNAQLMVVNQLDFPSAVPGQYLWPNWSYEGDAVRDVDYLDSAGSGVHGNGRIPFASAGQAGFAMVIDHHDTSYAITEGLGGRDISLQWKARCNNARNVKGAVLVWNGAVQSPTMPVVTSWNGAGVLPTLATGWNFITTPAAQAMGATYTVFKEEGLTVPAMSAANVAVLIWCDNAQSGDVFDVGEPQLETNAVCTEFEPVDFATTRARTQYNYYATYQPGTAPGGMTSVGQIERQIYVPNTSQIVFPVEFPTTMWLPTDAMPKAQVYCPQTGQVNKVRNVTQARSMSAGCGIGGSDANINGVTVTLNEGGANAYDRFVFHLVVRARFNAPGE